MTANQPHHQPHEAEPQVAEAGPEPTPDPHPQPAPDLPALSQQELEELLEALKEQPKRKNKGQLARLREIFPQLTRDQLEEALRRVDPNGHWNVAANFVASRFARRDRVEIIGLKGATEHNGKVGTVVKWSKAKGRFVVDVGLQKPIAVRPANLRAHNAAGQVPHRRTKADEALETVVGTPGLLARILENLHGYPGAIKDVARAGGTARDWRAAVVHELDWRAECEQFPLMQRILDRPDFEPSWRQLFVQRKRAEREECLQEVRKDQRDEHRPKSMGEYSPVWGVRSGKPNPAHSREELFARTDRARKMLIKDRPWPEAQTLAAPASPSDYLIGIEVRVENGGTSSCLLEMATDRDSRELIPRGWTGLELAPYPPGSAPLVPPKEQPDPEECWVGMFIVRKADGKCVALGESEGLDEEDDGLSHKIDGTVVSAQSPTPRRCANTAQLLAANR